MEENMFENEGTGAGFLKGLFIGGVMGALAGILFAPKAGRELRSDIVERSGEALDDAKQFYSEARMKAKDIMEDAQRRAEELKREASRQLAEARKKAKEVMRGAQEKASEAGEYARGVGEDVKSEMNRNRGTGTSGIETPSPDYTGTR